MPSRAVCMPYEIYEKICRSHIHHTKQEAVCVLQNLFEGKKVVDAPG